MHILSNLGPKEEKRKIFQPVNTSILFLPSLSAVKCYAEGILEKAARDG